MPTPLKPSRRLRCSTGRTALSFRKNILAKLGTEDAMTLYKRFRGREPKVEPLLKKRGLMN